MAVYLLCPTTEQQIQSTRKSTTKMFKNVGITTETNSKVVDFLDITFNLNNGIYKQYKNQTIQCYI